MPKRIKRGLSVRRRWRITSSVHAEGTTRMASPITETTGETILTGIITKTEMDLLTETTTILKRATIPTGIITLTEITTETGKTIKGR
tara:strand:- start:182 stop:445 length:264 start_codon:yes stop_codon:yes gene_type:complete